MSERKMAERYEWTDEKGELFQVTAAGRVERWWPHEQAWADASKHNACSELLRVVHERDRLMVIMAGALKSFAILGLGPGASGEDFTEAVQRVVEERDALRALVARQNALFKAEETFWTETDPGPHCPTCGGVHDGDQQLHTDDCEREALFILAADLLPEEDS